MYGYTSLQLIISHVEVVYNSVVQRRQPDTQALLNQRRSH